MRVHRAQHRSGVHGEGERWAEGELQSRMITSPFALIPITIKKKKSNPTWFYPPTTTTAKCKESWVHKQIGWYLQSHFVKRRVVLAEFSCHYCHINDHLGLRLSVDLVCWCGDWGEGLRIKSPPYILKCQRILKDGFGCDHVQCIENSGGIKQKGWVCHFTLPDGNLILHFPNLINGRPPMSL